MSSPEKIDEIEYKKIDLNTTEIKDQLREGQLYKKTGTVRAVQAEGGEEVITILADGTEETVNVAKKGDWIITNPDGDQYIINNEKFRARYEATNEEGVYSAKGYIRAIKNPYGEPIQHLASWGEMQKGSADCVVAVVCDEKGNFSNSEHPYIIAPEVFANTYLLVKNKK